ncbi:MAG: glycosyl hydrolase 53 family protein [Salinimicrobium sp.]
MKNLNYLFLFLVLLVSCSKDESSEVNPGPGSPEQESGLKVRAVDISGFPEIDQAGTVFFNSEGEQEDFLDILKNSGVNTVRLRLWVDPTNSHSGFEEVKAFSKAIRQKGFSLWLSLHYSDTWADPAHQQKPKAWKELSFNDLKAQVVEYTTTVVEQIEPDFVQVGNEINSGFLFPEGNISSNPAQFKELLEAGVNAVRKTRPQTRIIIHFAGYQNADWFYGQLTQLDYDIIGLSYYPLWHGKNLKELKNTLETLSARYDRQVILAETAYPFTLDYNDWTNNIIGLEEQLIPGYPASMEGQRAFLQDISKILESTESAIGFSYWGAELVAWNGPESKQGSPWENQALFDFNNQALPALKIFSDFQVQF